MPTSEQCMELIERLNSAALATTGQDHIDTINAAMSFVAESHRIGSLHKQLMAAAKVVSEEYATDAVHAIDVMDDAIYAIESAGLPTVEDAAPKYRNSLQEGF